MLREMKKALREVASESDAIFLQRFFKTGDGQYGAGDKFLGVRVPATRNVARRFHEAPFDDVLALLQSDWHEERLLALILMVRRYDKGDAAVRATVYKAYLANTRYINNWDLVDTSAEHIVGPHLFVLKNASAVLDKLAHSRNLWERRVAMLATFHHTRIGEYAYALRVAEQLLDDEHDLIHKAVGWMLREVGNREVSVEKQFLATHYRNMPRTMLRYAIEKFPESERLRYLRGTA